MTVHLRGQLKLPGDLGSWADEWNNVYEVLIAFEKEIEGETSRDTLALVAALIVLADRVDAVAVS